MAKLREIAPPAVTATDGFSAVQLEEKIRARAYELFEQRNGENGSPEDD